MISAKKYSTFLISFFLISVFLVLPAYVYYIHLSDSPIPQEYSYKYNEVTREGYPAVIDFIKKEAGFEDSETNKLSIGRNFIPGSEAWSFKLDEQFFVVFIFPSEEASKAALSGFSLKGYKFVDVTTKESAKLLWESTPQFYRKDNVLIVYTGKSKDMGRIIEKYLGNAGTVPAL